MEQSKPQWARKPSLKRKRTCKTSMRQLIVRKISTQGSPNDVAEVAEEEAVRRALEAEAATQRAIRLRAHAQALMEQADLATYRAVMAARIFDATSNASQAAPKPQSID